MHRSSGSREGSAATARRIVDDFASVAGDCLTALLVKYEGVERSTVWMGMFLQPRDGSVPVRSGDLEGLGSFQIHGRGCRFELESGADIDVDWDEDGRAVFDSWRLLMYARSVGAEVGRDALRAATSANPMLIQLGPDTFTWPGGRFAVDWRR